MRTAAALLLVVATGCACPHQDPVQTPARRPPLTESELTAMGKCLQPGLTLESRFFAEDEPHEGPATVREALEKYRPAVRGGKLCDRESGKEIYFYRPPDYGTPPLPGTLLEDAEKDRALNRRYKVIYLHSLIRPC